MIQVEFKYFGAFRDFKDLSKVSKLRFSEPPSVADIKKALIQEFQKQRGDTSAEGLVVDSAVSNEEAVLGMDDRVDHSCTLFLLPPVCGG